MNNKKRTLGVFFKGVVSLLLVLAIGLMGTQSVVAYDVADDGSPVHEYISTVALSLYPNDEINTYFDWILNGAEHEDLKDHIYARHDEIPPATTETHFWDADKGPGDPVDTSPLPSGPNAWQKAQVLWGMAIGEYASGDKETAYEYLGHVGHLLADMTVPSHAHEDPHPAEFLDDDCYEEWMTVFGGAPYLLGESELAWLNSAGLFEIPDGAADPLFYLFYTTNQIGDFFPSDDYDGDTYDSVLWGGWMWEIYSNLGMSSVTEPKIAAELIDNDWGPGSTPYEMDAGNNDGDGHLSVIRKYCYLNAIRAVAALYKLFIETVSQNSALTVVIERIKAGEVAHDTLDGADFFVVVRINGFWFKNEGNRKKDDDDVQCVVHGKPGWAFARNVGLSGSAEVAIQLWDEDWPDPDDKSDIDPAEGRKDLDLTINLANGAISGDVTGMCGVMLNCSGTEDEHSKIWFRILLPNIPPTANAGPDQTVDEGDLVTLTGSFTDPNTEDTHTIEWDFGDGSPTATGTLTPTHAYGDNGAYTVTLTVTDDGGGVGVDTLMVTVNNVAPTATIDSMTQPNPQFVLPIVHTLTFTGSFTDPGWLDTHTATWDFGDGTVVPGTLTEENVEPDATGTTTADHVYSDPGTYTVTLTITDDDGGVGTDTMEVIVVSAEEAREIINEYIQNLPNSAFGGNPRQRKKALINMFSAVGDMLADEEWKGAIEDLLNNIRVKSDGFVDGRLSNDWIIDPTTQQEICMMIDDLTAYLETLL